MGEADVWHDSGSKAEAVQAEVVASCCSRTPLVYDTAAARERKKREGDEATP